MARQLIKDANEQKVWRFDNGYGASVIWGRFAYGGERGLFELGVMLFVGDSYGLTYDTPITDDVLGWLTEADVETTLDLIEALPPAVEEVDA